MKTTQFQTLIQHELKRLEGIVAQNEASTYPVVFRSYRSITTQKQPSSYYRFLSFVRVVQFLF